MLIDSIKLDFKLTYHYELQTAYYDLVPDLNDRVIECIIDYESEEETLPDDIQDVYNRYKHFTFLYEEKFNAPLHIQSINSWYTE